MGMKREITGKAVIYTADGVKVIDAEVRRYFNVHSDERRARFNFEKDYLFIDCARTIPTDNIYAKPAFKPEVIRRAVNFAESKFFRFSLELMKLAQWQPVHKYNTTFGWSRDNVFDTGGLKNIDYDKDVDAQLFNFYEFTPAMIDFVESKIK